jgi:hypothetical protein
MRSLGSTNRAAIIVFWLFLVAIVAVYVDDSAKAPVFPGPVYCLIGAGTFVSVPATTRATSWLVNPGGPNTPDGWTTTPESVDCIHETIWKGWKARYEARFGEALKMPSFSVSNPKMCRAENSNQLAEWFNRSLMTKPQLANAFSRCMDPVASLQEKLLKELDAEATSATSRSTQISVSERAKAMRSRLDVDRKFACLKVALDSLRIEGPPTYPGGPIVSGPGLPSIEDHFKYGWRSGPCPPGVPGHPEFKRNPATCGVRLENNPNGVEDVVRLADRKLNDLTPQGAAELAERMSLAKHDLDPLPFLPRAYFGTKFDWLGPGTPLLDGWVETLATTIECH